MSQELTEHLRELNKNNTTTTIAELNKKFPKCKKEIKSFVFLGLLEHASHENHHIMLSKVV